MFEVREAASNDCERLIELVAELGFDVTSSLLRSNFDALTTQHLCPIVAHAEEVIGCVTYNIMPVLHRSSPVGRISMLVVSGDWRGRGVGRSLVDAAFEKLRVGGCRLCEVTSNVALVDAHAFYERLGFERTSVRLVRPI
jgi:ribosomal protein S18 acetylase RimI-like enzyme